MLLDRLTALDGIGLTIASGLIWTADPFEAVPFDKFTMTYALNERILHTDRISGGRYEGACQKILAYIESKGDGWDYGIEEFVVEARQKMIDFPILTPPR